MDINIDGEYRGFGNHLEFGTRPALLIIDFVNAYLDPVSPMYSPVEGARQKCVRLLALAREIGIPVIFSTIDIMKGGADAGIFYRKVPGLKAFEPGSPFAAFADGLEPLENELVVRKQYASSFFGTSLASYLAANRIDTLVITGVSTSGCVRATTLDACQHGYLPFVVGDACGDRTEVIQQGNLYDLQAKYAEVISCEKAEELLRASSEQG